MGAFFRKRYPKTKNPKNLTFFSLKKGYLPYKMDKVPFKKEKVKARERPGSIR